MQLQLHAASDSANMTDHDSLESLEKRLFRPRKRLGSRKCTHDKGDWLIAIYSSETLQNASAAITVYTDEGSSGQIILGTAGQANNDEWFQADSVDEFKVNLRGLGMIYKVRVELIPNGPDLPCYPFQPHWKLHEIEMFNPQSKEHIRFKFDRYLTRLLDDYEIVRELAVHRAPLTPKATVDVPDNASEEEQRKYTKALERERAARERRNLALVRYEVEIFTESPSGCRAERHREEREGASSGSESATYDAHVANVFIMFFGEHGDCGKRILYRNKNTISTLAPRVAKRSGRKLAKRESRRYLFLPGHVDEFAIEAVWLGRLKKCIIGLERCVWPHDAQDSTELDGDANTLRQRQASSKCRTMRLFCSKIAAYDPYEDVRYEFQCNRELFLDENDTRCEVKLRWKASKQAPPGSTPARLSHAHHNSSLETESEFYSSELLMEPSEMEPAVTDDEDEGEDEDIEGESKAQLADVPVDSARCRSDLQVVEKITDCKDGHTQRTPVHRVEASVQTDMQEAAHPAAILRADATDAIESILLDIAYSVSSYSVIRQEVEMLVDELIEAASNNLNTQQCSSHTADAVESQPEPHCVHKDAYLVEIWTVSSASALCVSSARIELRGSNGTSKKRILRDNLLAPEGAGADANAALFQADQVNRFYVHCDDLGNIEAVKLLHDAIGLGDHFEWCISKLVVTHQNKRWSVRHGCTVQLSSYIRAAECCMTEEKNYAVSFILGCRYASDIHEDALLDVSLVLHGFNSENDATSEKLALRNGRLTMLNNENVCEQVDCDNPEGQEAGQPRLIKPGSKVQYRILAPAVAKINGLNFVSLPTGFGSGFYLDGIIIEVYDALQNLNATLDKDFYAFLCTTWLDSNAYHNAGSLYDQTFVPLVTSPSMLAPRDTHESCILEICSGDNADCDVPVHSNDMNVVTFTFFDFDGREVAMQKVLIDSPVHRAYVDLERLDRVIGLRIDCESKWWFLRNVALRLMRVKDTEYCRLPIGKWFGVRRKNALNVRDFIFPNKLLCRNEVGEHCNVRVRTYYVLLETSGIRRLAAIIQAGTAIFVTLKGKHGESGRTRLSRSNFIKAFPISAEKKRELCAFYMECFDLDEIVKVTLEIEPLNKGTSNESQSFEINDEISKREREDASSFFTPSHSPTEPSVQDKKKEILQIEKLAIQESLMDIKQLSFKMVMPITLPPTVSSTSFAKDRIFSYEFQSSKLNAPSPANNARANQNMDSHTDWLLYLNVQAQLCNALALDEASCLKLLKHARFIVTICGLLGEMSLSALSDAILDPLALSFAGLAKQNIRTFNVDSLNVGAITKIRIEYLLNDDASESEHGNTGDKLSDELAAAIEFCIFGAKLKSKTSEETLRFWPDYEALKSERSETRYSQRTHAAVASDIPWAKLPMNSQVEIAAIRPDCTPLMKEEYTVKLTLAKQCLPSNRNEDEPQRIITRRHLRADKAFLHFNLSGEFGNSPINWISNKQLVNKQLSETHERIVLETYETTLSCINLGDLRNVTLSHYLSDKAQTLMIEDFTVTKRHESHDNSGFVHLQTNKFGPKMQVESDREYKLVLESSVIERNTEESWKVKVTFNQDYNQSILQHYGFFIQFCTADDDTLPMYVTSATKVVHAPHGEKSKQPLNFDSLVKVRVGLQPTQFSLSPAELHIRKIELMNLATTKLCVVEQLSSVSYLKDDESFCDNLKEAALIWPGRAETAVINETVSYELSVELSKLGSQCDGQCSASQFVSEFPSVHVRLIGEFGTSGARCLYCRESDSLRNENLRSKLLHAREQESQLTLTGRFECLSLGELKAVLLSVADDDEHKAFMIDSIDIKRGEEALNRLEIQKLLPSGSASSIEIPVN